MTKANWTFKMLDVDTMKEYEVKTFKDRPSASDLLILVEKHSAIDFTSKQRKEQLLELQRTIDKGVGYNLFSDTYTLHHTLHLT